MQKTLLIILTVLLSGAVLARPSWHAPDATHRLRFNVPHQHQANLIIPIPPELEVLDLLAADDKGRIIPASPIRIDKRIVAAVINGRTIAAPLKKDTLVPNASLYLLSRPSVQSLPYDGQPVQMTRFVKTLTTRAHTGAEMLRMFANLHLIPYPQARRNHAKISPQRLEVKGFGNLGQRKVWQRFTPSKGGAYVRAFTTASAILAIEQDTQLILGTDQPQVAWAILVDAKPVADWVSASQEGFGPALTLAPGLHSIQLLAVQSKDETLPRLLTKNQQGKPTELTGLLPSNVPRTLRLEFRDHPQLDAESSLQLLHSQSFSHALPSTALDAWQILTPDSRRQYLQAYADTRSSLLVTHDFQVPAFRFLLAGKYYTFAHLPPLWHHNQAQMSDLTVTAPLIAAADKPLALEVSLRLPPDFPAKLAKHLSIHCTQVPPNSKPLNSQNLPARQGINRLALAIHPIASELHITAHLGNVPIAAPQPLKLLTPNQATIPLRASGRQLFAGIDQATLLVTDDTGSTLKTQHNNGILAVYDDLLLTKQAPGADLLPLSAGSRWLPVTVPSGAHPALAFLANLSQLLKLAPQRALFMVNPEYAMQPDWMLQITFAVHACRQAGIRPELIIPPSVAGDRRFQQLPQAALQAKLTARHLRLHVHDLYTLGLLQHLDTSPWKIANGIHVDTLNNDARIYLLNTLNQLMTPLR